MAFRSDKQRRAAFAHMNRPGKHWPTAHGFPTHGRGAIARRNRAIAASAALGVGGVALIGATEAGRRGPLRALTGLTGRRNYSGGSGYTYSDTFSTARGASRGEAALGRLVPPLGRAMGLRRVQARADVLPAYEVRGVPLDAGLRGATKKALARTAEQMSLWNIGGKGKLLSAIEGGSHYAQRAARYAATKPIRALARTLEHGVERRLGAATRSLTRLNRRVAGRIRLAGRQLAVKALKEAVA